nr:fumarylacetoacetate hydrolase family protein [Bacillus massiliglaciei]
MAEHLQEAEAKGQGTVPLTELHPDLTPEDAYQVQLLTIQKKTSAGQTITGKKIGLTSAAMQEMLGVSQPDYGHLLDSMVIENGGVIKQKQVIQPKIEAEIAFVLKNDLYGPGVTALDVMTATDYIVPALEIVDSRIAEWKITLSDTIADNASSGLYVLGEKKTIPAGLDISQIGMAFYKNGELVNTGVGAAALGNPAACVAWLANKLSGFGIGLKAGEVILSGALSAAVSGTAGDEFTARFAHLGEVSVRFDL